MGRASTPKIKSTAAAVRVPQSRAEVVTAIAEIGKRQRERDRIQAAMNDELAQIRERYETEAEPHARAIDELQSGVQTWCEANRDALTQGGKTKTAAFASGEVKWRVTPPKVAIKGVEAVIHALRKAGLGRFLREKVEISKDAILAEPEAIKKIAGISISQVEEFVIEPFATELEEMRS
jgi:phage host-nuclease inhibitor protein Gam